MNKFSKSSAALIPSIRKNHLPHPFGFQGEEDEKGQRA
jgi:hypothetical protein